MELKDILTLTLSGLAFVLSIIATAVTLRQKKAETERTVRQQLTDTISKINGVFEQFEKLRDEQRGRESDPSVVALRSFYNGQKRFLVRQAIFLITQIPSLTSEAEYNCVARALIDIGDFDEALKYLDRAIEASPAPLYRAMNLTSKGRAYFVMGNLDLARAAYNGALQLVPGTDDAALWYRAEAYQRWGVLESEVSNTKEAEPLFSEAAKLYSQIHHPIRRKQGLANLAAVRAELDSHS